MYYSVCAIAKEEQDYLEEWVCSNMATGAEHFFIYDNKGSVPVKETLSKYIDARIVSVIDFPGKSAQMPAYTHCLFNFGSKSKWIGFFDCDEIMIPREKDTVQEVLKDYEGYGGFNVSWKIYGSNNHKTRPPGMMIENYIATIPQDHYENTHTKAIVQPEKTLRAGSNPHHFVFKPGYYSVSEDLKVVPNAWTPHCSSKLQLNHYFLKSLEEFKTKIQRPRADDVRLEARKLEDFYKFDDLCTHTDACAYRFIEKTKKMYIK
jgi:hypothetical protein